MKRLINTWHKKLGWWGLAALSIWVLSGLTHPIMSWFGPQTAAFFAPKLVIDHTQVAGFNALLRQAEVHKNAQVIKLVANAEYGALLQVTRSGQTERDYYHLQTQQKLNGFDQKQAKWLASYYSGAAQTDIVSVRLINEFNTDYPSVNRLLPVYQVDFSSGTRAYVFTETNSLASITNDFKENLKAIFIQLHTFQWLHKFEFGRLLIVSLFMLSLLAMSLTGLGLVIVLKQRKIKQASRRYHRYLAYLLWLPLLGWSASGFYHLLYSSQSQEVSGLRLQETAQIDTTQGLNNGWIARYQDYNLSSVSVVKDRQNQAVLRISIAPKTDVNANRESRFKGMPSESKAIYINPYTGKERDDLNDKQQAELLAERFSGSDTSAIEDIQLVTHYGPDYDFRNKRLPVWNVKVNNDNASWLFVDPVTGVLVDQSRNQDRLERLSFSLLHKWNHLTPFIGRMWRDSTIVLTLLLLILIAGLGAKMMLTKRK
ncbi:MAG: hypothetical protein HWE26_01385 [Alteromonadaceae bacterium]|nr:hypothetical protein [Alteromonadaceae bacterium]